MSTETRIPTCASSAASAQPPFIFNAAFDDPSAEKEFGETTVSADDDSLGFMPNDVTRDCTKRMHYAAWRVSLAQPGT